MRLAYLRKPDDMKRGNPSKEKRKVFTPDKVKMPTSPVPTCTLTCGEDEASLIRHTKMLKSEMKKVNPNKQIVQKLMQKTFVLRRRDFLEETRTVHEVLQSYPALKYPEEVS